MSIAYLRIKRASALRLAQMIGNDQVTLETAYTGSWASALDGAEIPSTAFKDTILAVEKEMAQVIGNNPQHPARALLYGRTSSLVNLSVVPSVDILSKEFVGVFDACTDAETNRPCTWQPLQTVMDIVHGAPAYFGDQFYYYHLVGKFIYHTRSSVFLQGCVWSYTTQSDAYDADGDSPLPEALEAVWIDGVIARATQVGWIEDKTGYYSNLYQQGLSLFGSGTPNNIPLASQNVVGG